MLRNRKTNTRCSHAVETGRDPQQSGEVSMSGLHFFAAGYSGWGTTADGQVL